MTTADDVRTIESMRRYGGAFHRALAEAAARADDDNLSRLKRAFPDAWREYAQMVRAGRRGLTDGA